MEKSSNINLTPSFVVKNFILLTFVLIFLMTSCKKDSSNEIRFVDPILNCNLNDSMLSFPIQHYEAGPDVHLNTKYLSGIIVFSSLIRFESETSLDIQIHKRFQINSLTNSTSLIESKSHGDTIIDVFGINNIYKMTDQEFGSIYKIGDVNIVKKAGSYETFDDDGVIVSYSTNKGTYYSTDLLLSKVNNTTPYFKIEKFEYLNNFKYKNLNEAIGPISDKAYYVTAKFSMKFVDNEHLDTLLIKDANVEFVVYNSQYLKK